MLRNSTNIPDRLVAIALSFAMNDESMTGIEPPSLVTVKNKARGRVAGQWGWYYPRDRHVVVIVPRELKNYTALRKYANTKLLLRNRSDFLVAVLAHEIRHCYQYQKWTDPRGKWRLGYDPIAKIARETDAELYETKRLHAWHVETTRGILVARR